MPVLDTNTLVDILRKVTGAEERITEIGKGPEPLALSSITLAELYLGAYRHHDFHNKLILIDQVSKNFVILNVDEKVAAKYGEIQAAAIEQGKRLPSMDLLIACTALVHGYQLITDNMKHFSKVPGLRVEPWLSSIKKNGRGA